MRDVIAIPTQATRSVRGLPDRRTVPARPSYGTGDDQTRLREISDFSGRYESKKRKSMVLAMLLIVFSASCLVLFMLDVNIIAFFGIGAMLILLQLLHYGYDLLEEGAHVQHAYRTYLAGFPPQALARLRYSMQLSNWTKYEIDKFIASFY